ncbi:MAG: 4-diphosphocytidyl-2-C-methyl-D-erythritol kinase [Chlamydiales bacterium]
MRTYFSPAKINLFFRVLGRRDDGFHEVATLMQAIDLGDSISFELTERDILTCEDPALPTDSSNLILKASKLFRQKTGLNIYIKAHLDKKIPWQAGLGGGSGNAATTLWAMNDLCGFPVAEKDLLKWSGEIGSDVPFFLSSGTAYCTGRGEQVESISLDSGPKGPMYVVKPSTGLATPGIFKRLDISTIDGRQAEEILSSFSSTSPQYVNDLEKPAFLELPSLGELKKSLLSAGFQSVMMTGSGSAFFCCGGLRTKLPEELKIYQINFLKREKGSWYQN